MKLQSGTHPLARKDRIRHSGAPQCDEATEGPQEVVVVAILRRGGSSGDIKTKVAARVLERQIFLLVRWGGGLVGN